MWKKFCLLFSYKETRSNFHFPLDHFLYNFTIDHSNFFLFPLNWRFELSGVDCIITIKIGLFHIPAVVPLKVCSSSPFKTESYDTKFFIDHCAWDNNGATLNSSVHIPLFIFCRLMDKFNFHVEFDFWMSTEKNHVTYPWGSPKPGFI